MVGLRKLGISLFGALAFNGPALAADPYGGLPAPAAAAPPRIFEIRLGAYSHDPVSPEKGSADLNAEFLADPFRRDRSNAWSFLLPRLHLGATASLSGRTSQIYSGFTWTIDLTERIFIEGGLGAALHNGKTTLLAPLGFNAMGCSWGFHEQAALGYRLSEAWSVMLAVEHTSNAGVCKQNRGLTNAGVRLGYRF